MNTNSALKSLAAGMLVSVVSAGEPVSPEGLLPDSLRWDRKSFQAQTVPARFRDGVETQAARFESIPLESLDGRASRIDDLNNPLGERLARMVEDTLARAFGNGDKPDFAYLAQVFSGESKSILRGTAARNAKGEESVRYFWVTPREWLLQLRNAVERKGFRYQVNLSIIWVYQDNLDPNRFWAVVRQDWQTLDGKAKPAYRDDGFLFLNFDLDSNRLPRNMRVNYRLWFYNYGKPRKDQPRWLRTANDIRGALDPNADANIDFGRMVGDKWVPDANERGLSGIDRQVLGQMSSDLIGALRSAQGDAAR
jgi:hypothetical protein